MIRRRARVANAERIALADDANDLAQFIVIERESEIVRESPYVSSCALLAEHEDAVADSGDGRRVVERRPGERRERRLRITMLVARAASREHERRYGDDEHDRGAHGRRSTRSGRRLEYRHVFGQLCDYVQEFVGRRESR